MLATGFRVGVQAILVCKLSAPLASRLSEFDVEEIMTLVVFSMDAGASFPYSRVVRLRSHHGVAP